MKVLANRDKKDKPLDITWSGDTCVSCDSVSNIVLGNWRLMFVSGFLRV